MPVFALFFPKLNRRINPLILFYVLSRGSTTAFRLFGGIVFPILLLNFKSARFKSPILFSLHPFFLCKEFDKILIETATRFVVSNFFEKNQKNGFVSMLFLL